MAPARPTHVLGLAAALALMLLPVAALAADAEKAAAKAHYEAATRLYDIKEWAKALDEYKAAYLSKPDPAFLFNIGQCYKKLGQQEQALEFYKEYLKKAPQDDPNRSSVEARVREIESGQPFEAESGTRAAPSSAQPLPAPVPETRPLDSPAEPRIVRPAELETPLPAPVIPPAQPAPPPGLDVSVAASAAPAETGTRFYKTWWFWTGVGAAVAAGSIVAIVASSGGKQGNSADTALGTQPVFQ